MVRHFQQVRPKAHLRDPSEIRPDHRPTGRLGRIPSYREEYCDGVVDFMAQGFSLTAFAGSIRLSKETIYGWIRDYPDFSLSVERARAARLAYWEKRLMDSQRSAEAAASIFALKNADAEEWREVRYASYEHEVNVKTLTDEQLLAIASGQRPAAVGAIDVTYNRMLEKPKRFQAPRSQRKKDAT